MTALSFHQFGMGSKIAIDVRCQFERYWFLVEDCIDLQFGRLVIVVICYKAPERGLD
jgi:hypothetical protein